MAEERIVEPHSRVLLTRSHDHGRIRFQRAIERTDTVAKTGSDMQVGNGDAARCLRVEAGGADCDAFMQRYDDCFLKWYSESASRPPPPHRDN